MGQTARGVLVVGLLLTALEVGACTRVPTLHEDQQDMRGALLCLYEDQVMDNIIRTQNLLPIVQIDYGKMTGTVDTTLRGKATAGIENTAKEFGVRPADLIGPVAGTNTDVASLKGAFGLEGENTKKSALTVTGEPVLSNADVYRAYLEFVRKPGRVLVGGRAHPDAHIGRWWRRSDHEPARYYYVPTLYAGEFMDLFLTTTVLRTPLGQKQYFEVTISGVEPLPQGAQGPGAVLTLKLASKVPNDSGRLSSTLDGFLRSFLLQESGDVRAGSPTDKLTLIVKDTQLPPATPNSSYESRVGAFVGTLVKQPARLYLDSFVPQLDKTEKALEDIRQELQLIRLGGTLTR